MIRTLAGHTAAYTFANLAARGTALAWLVVLPSFMSPADYGALGLILTAAALVSLVVPLEVPQALARYFPSAGEAEKQELAKTAWTFTLLALSGAGALALIFARPLCETLLGDGRYLDAFRVAIGFFAANTLFLFLQHQLRWEFRIRDYTIVTLAFAFVTLAASIGLAMVFEEPLLGVVLGQALGAGTGVILGFSMLRRRLHLGLVASRLRQLLRFSLPIVPASLALFIGTYASRFILQDLLDLREVGIFTWASQLSTVPAMLLLGVQGALTPLVMKHYEHDDTKVVLARSFEAIVAVQLVLCLGLAAFTPELIRLLGYDEFAGAAPLVLLLAPAYVMLQLYVFAPGFAVAEKTHLQLLVSVIAAIAAVAANYLLIDQFGVFGAAVASLVAATAFIGSWFVLSHFLYPVPVRWSRVGLLVTLAAASGVVNFRAGGSGSLMSIGLKVAVVAAFAAFALVRIVRDGDLKALVAKGSPMAAETEREV